jgi:O-antigen ligase
VWVLAATHISIASAFLALCGLFFAAGLFIFPKASFLLVAAVIPLERIGRLTPDSSMYTVSVMRFVGLLALAVFLLHAAAKRWRLRFGAAFALYAAFCVWAICTVTFSSDTLGGVRAISAILGNLLFFFLVVNMARDWTMIRAAVVVWLLACTVIGLYTIYEWHSGSFRMAETQLGATSERFSTVLRDNSEWESLGITVDRALGTTSSPAVHGINMIMTVPFFIFFFRTQRSWLWRGLALAGGLVAIYNAFLTNTRAAILVVMLTVVLCLAWRMIALTPRVLVILAACALLIVSFSPEAMYQRVLKLSNYSLAGSGTLQTRMQYWEAGLQIIEQHWTTGVGMGNQLIVPALANVRGPDESTVHNEFLEMMIETGVFGWLLFFGFVGLLLWCAFKAATAFRRRPHSGSRYWFMVACIIAMLSVLVYGLQVDVFHFPLKGWWLVAGLTWTMYLLSRPPETTVSKPIP